MSVITTTIRMEDSQFFASLNRMEGRLGSLAANFALLAGRMAIAFAPVAAGVGGVTATVFGLKKAIDEAAKMEQLLTSFEVLIGSADVAKETLADLQRFADETTFQMPEVAGAAKQLIAFGVGAKDVVSTLRMLGDVASGLNIPLSELTDVYGRNLVQGRLFSRDIYQFQSRGIPIIAALAAQFGVAENEIMGMVEAGQVGSAEMVKAFQDLTKEGGLFAGMLARQSRTFNGLMSTLADNITAVFREFGKPLIEVLKPVVDSLIHSVKEMVPAAQEFGNKVARVISGLQTAFQSGQFTELVGVALELGFARAINALAGGLETALAIAGGAFVEVIGDANFWDGLLKTLLGIAAQFGAAILRAFEKPLAYVQAFMEKSVGGPGVKSDFRIEQEARKEAERRLIENDPRFAGKSANDFSANSIRGRWGAMGRSDADDALLKEFTAARDKMAAGLAKEMGAQTLEERANAILGSGGTRFGFSGAGMNTAEIAQEAQAMMREGMTLMKEPAGNFLEAARLISANYEPAALYDEAKMRELEERLRKAFPALPGTPEAGDAANARAGKGPGDIMGGAQATIIADSLAKIGGGGGYSSVSAALDEARAQTSELRDVNKNLTDVKQLLGRTGGAADVTYSHSRS